MKYAILLSVFGFLLLENTALAQSVIEQNEPYRKCVGLSQTDPAEAMVFSKRWVKVDPSSSALHCRGLVLFEQEHFAEAATVLDRLSDSLKMASPVLRIGVYRQSSRAWQRAGDLTQAVARLGQAMKLINPERDDAVTQRQEVEILMDRAKLYNEMKKPLDSIQDLDQALTYGILKDQVLITRAKVETSNGQAELAIKDLQEVLKENPHHEEAQSLLKTIVEKKP